MKKFSELTKQQQKMRIVKDAIAQINLKTIKVTTGTYFDFPEMYVTPKETGLKELLKSKKYKCEACAKGALFAACVVNVNKVTLEDDIGDEYFQKDKLKKWFSPLELDMIETAFEKCVMEDSEGKLVVGYWLDGELTEKAKDSIAFGSKYKSDKARLLAILENILKYGKFTPDAT